MLTARLYQVFPHAGFSNNLQVFKSGNFRCTHVRLRFEAHYMSAYKLVLNYSCI